MKPIILVPLIALALAGSSAGGYFWLSSEGSVEEAAVAQPTATPAPTAEPTPTPAPTETPTATPAPTEPLGGAGGELGPATVVPPPTPSTSLPPAPEDWATFANTKIVPFSFRYPSDWYAGPGSGTLSSWDPTTWDKPYYPPNGIMLQIGVASIDKAEVRPPEATDITVAGVAGWEVVNTYDPATSGGKTRVHIVAAYGDRYQVQLQAYYAQENPDETTFYQIVNSFRFTD